MVEHPTVLLCASPKAGSGKGREQIPRLLERLSVEGYKTIAPSSLVEIRSVIAEFAQQKEPQLVIVAAGGDGTVSLVAELADHRIPIVPMPLGTENLLARYFGYTADAEQVFQAIQSGHNRLIDAGRANGKLFLVMASCGFDAEVVRALHLRRKGHIGRFSYTKPILRAMSTYRFPELSIEMDCSESVTLTSRWAMVFNLPCYGGGLHIEPDAIGDDGLLDLIAFGGGSIMSGLRYVSGIFAHRHTQFSDVKRIRGTRIRITANQRVPYQLDGDYVGRLPLEIELLPKRVLLRMLGGRRYTNLRTYAESRSLNDSPASLHSSFEHSTSFLWAPS